MNTVHILILHQQIRRKGLAENQLGPAPKRGPTEKGRRTTCSVAGSGRILHVQIVACPARRVACAV